ncbi:MAG: hypothetical protein DRI44_01470 [Chlamydiae bacterium]|nr:MAG: hypothetical protein DRI44_01470 [Chlamydiota bacterium]
MKTSLLTDLYPKTVTAVFGANTPKKISAAGNTELLNNKKIGLFVSVNCPGVMIFQSYDFVFKMRTREKMSFISGFHSPMERECLRSLAAGATGIIWCIAKSLESFKLPEDLGKTFDDGRMLILSSFPENVTRITKETSMLRNKLVAAIADESFFSYAAPGGKTEKLCCEALEWGKPVFTLKEPENQGIIDRGAVPIDVNNVESYWPKEDKDVELELS